MALTDETKNTRLTDENVDAINDVIDIQLDTVKRTKFRINGNNDAIIELNLSDLGIMSRLETGMKQLQDAMNEIVNISDEDSDFRDKLKQADEKMREYVDYIFDYPVSTACAKYGTMYDPKDGVYRYEAIIDGLTKLYADNLNDEYNKIKARMEKHTAKYVTPMKGTNKKRK